MAKAQPQPRGPSPGRGVAGVPWMARGRGQAVAGSERWFSVSGFRFSVKEPLQKLLPSEALAKLPIDNNCHSERSEESRIFRRLRSLTSFRMTEKPVLVEAQTIIHI